MIPDVTISSTVGQHNQALRRRGRQLRQRRRVRISQVSPVSGAVHERSKEHDPPRDADSTGNARARLATRELGGGEGWLPDANRLRSDRPTADPLQPPPLFADALPALWEQLHVAPEVSVNTPWMLVRRDTGEAAGLAGLVLEEAGTAQIGYAVYPEQAGRGFATEAVRCLVQWSLEWPTIRRVRATVPPQNRASVRVLEKAGFRLVTTAWDEDAGDVLIYAVDAQSASADDRDAA